MASKASAVSDAIHASTAASSCGVVEQDRAAAGEEALDEGRAGWPPVCPA